MMQLSGRQVTKRVEPVSAVCGAAPSERSAGFASTVCILGALINAIRRLRGRTNISRRGTTYGGAKLDTVQT
jgi:hypothetical protein